MEIEKFIEIAEVPEKVGFSENDVYQWIIYGTIECISFQNRLLVSQHKLTWMMNELTRHIFPPKE